MYGMMIEDHLSGKRQIDSVNRPPHSQEHEAFCLLLLDPLNHLAETGAIPEQGVIVLLDGLEGESCDEVHFLEDMSSLMRKIIQHHHVWSETQNALSAV